jgi:hypothetical protein
MFKKLTISALVCCVALAHAMKSSLEPSRIREDQQEKYVRYTTIITPILVEAARTNGKRVLNLSKINDSVFSALIRDISRMLTQISVVIDENGNVGIINVVSLDEIVRLTLLCDFLHECPRYAERATTLADIVKQYCSNPATRELQKERLKVILNPLRDKEKTK